MVLLGFYGTSRPTLRLYRILCENGQPMSQTYLFSVFTRSLAVKLTAMYLDNSQIEE